MRPEEAKQHIEQIRLEKFGIAPDLKKQPNPLERDLRAALKNLAEELNAKETHFILELLQNAEDNSYPEGVEPELCIAVEDTDPTGKGGDGCLYVLNNEAGFTPAQVWSLCSVGQSTKDKARGYIGEKGIGFKSVFRVSDQPHIFSNGFQFRFQKPQGPDDLGYIVPDWIDSVPDVVRPGFTGIFLPLIAGKRAGIAEKLRTVPPETILFLTQLRRLGLGREHFVARDKTLGVVKLFADAAESLYFVHRENWPRPDDLFEEKRMGIDEREVKVALPFKSARPCTGRVFAFLPTEFETGLPFLVNADFLLSASRDNLLEDRRWNQWLRDAIAPTFVKAFLSVLNESEWKADAYRFLPLATDLAPGADFFAPIVGSVHERLRVEKCVLTKAGDYVLPNQAHFASPLVHRILLDTPPERSAVPLVHPDLAHHSERLKPLGVQLLKFAQLFEACNDESWLKSRDGEWWEALFELCTKCEVTAATIGSFPILRCRDGLCRPLSCGVFSNAEDQPTATGISSDWPAVHLLDTEIQQRLQLKPILWAWLTQVAGLRPFSVQAYVTGRLLGWMHGKTGEQLIEATRFIAKNLARLDPQARQALREKMPWLLADGRMLFPEGSSGKELVTPECLEGEAGWNHLFPALDRHFFVINDGYCAGLSGESLTELRQVFKTCEATAFPDPRLRELSPGDLHYGEALVRCAHTVHGTPRLRDRAAPGWLLGLERVEQTGNGQRKVEALERWLKAQGPDYAKTFLHCSKPDYQDGWQQINAWSEFGGALHKKPWLRTSKGYVAPPAAFLATPEIREFFGDSVAYVATDLAAPLLDNLGVHVHLTAEVLIGQLREMSGRDNPDLALLAKIYRRLQDSTFDVNLFRREKLIFLSKPKPRWLSAEKLVWDDAGELFDDDFGYVSLTHGKSELHRFFTETLKIPAQPELRHYATAWASLCLATSPDRQTVERKIKAILPRLADSQIEFSDSNWWRELKLQLRLWTDREEFQSPAQVYVPDHSTAVELFAGRIHVAFPPTPSRAVLAFLRSMLCRSLAAAVQTKLVGAAGECARPTSFFLTPAAKELCVLFVCSQHGWERRCSHLEALLETAEVGVKEITVEYCLNDNREAGTQPLPREAHWDVAGGRLLLRDGVDAESLRDAAAKSIAAEFFGEAASAEMQAEFFRVLTVALERARKLMRERSNWRLTTQQQAWLREQRWQILITELDEVEQPPAPRPPTEPMPPNTTAPAPAAESSQPHSANSRTAIAQGAGSAANQTAPTAPGQSRQETPRSDSDTGATNPEQEPHAQSASDAPVELHDAETTTADFVPVRVHTRSRLQRPQSQQTQDNRREAASGLTSTSAKDKAALEQRGREVATKKLASMGYKVTIMSQHNPGFDLKGEKPGDTLKVEVKAHAQKASSVFVTQREWEEYLRTRNVPGYAWELWNVEKLAKTSGLSPTIQRVGYIPKGALKESGYWVDLSQCSQEPPKSGTSEPL